MKKILFYTFLLFCLTGICSTIFAQGQRNVVVFTGRVVGKNAATLSKVYIFIPKAGRGVLSDESGFFALQVFPGDSILFSHVAYEKQYFMVPRRLMEESYSAIVMLKEDIKTLKEVRIYPYSTEQEFKDAFLSLKLPDELDRKALEKNMRPDYLMSMALLAPMGSMANYRLAMDQQQYSRENPANRSNMNTQLFNPMALMSLFSAVKRGDFKTKDYRKVLNQAPKENIKRSDLLKK